MARGIVSRVTASEPSNERMKNMTESTAAATAETTATATARESSMAARIQKLSASRSALSEARCEVSLRKAAEMESYARQKTGEKTGFSHELNAWIVLFDKTRSGKRISRQFAVLTKRIDATTAAIRVYEGQIEAIAEIARSKAAARQNLIEFNESIKNRRVYSFSQRRRSAWGRVQTFHSIDAHRVKKLPDGRFVVDRHTLTYDVVYLYRESEARLRVEGRGDVFVSGPGAEVSKLDVIKILAKPLMAANNGAVTDWKEKYEKQFKSRESFEKYSKILERTTDPRNKYARWLVSLGACNNGICTAMSRDPRSPYDTLRAANPAEIAWLRNHATLKSNGAVPKLYELTEELCLFPAWENFT